MIVFGFVPAPFGELLVAKEGDAVIEIRFQPDEIAGRRDDDAIADAAAQLGAYFRGERRAARSSSSSSGARCSASRTAKPDRTRRSRVRSAGRRRCAPSARPTERIRSRS